MTDKIFEKINKKNIALMAKNPSFRNLTKSWFKLSEKYQYSYHFSWMGRPIIQYPQDIIALQEIIWKVQPELIIETLEESILSTQFSNPFPFIIIKSA